MAAIPQLVPVESSNLRAVGYDEAGPTLYIQFKSKKGDSVYAYDGVPHEKWVGLLQATSKGKFLSTEVKGHYRATKIA